jgi:hypothetical protein
MRVHPIGLHEPARVANKRAPSLGDASFKREWIAEIGYCQLIQPLHDRREATAVTMYHCRKLLTGSCTFDAEAEARNAREQFHS